MRDATGNATACDVSLKQLRRALQSFDGQARVGGERGTLSIETTVSTSAVQPSCSAKMSIFDRGGSSGNSLILRPNGVRAPVLSSAPSTQS